MLRALFCVSSDLSHGYILAFASFLVSLSVASCDLVSAGGVASFFVWMSVASGEVASGLGMAMEARVSFFVTMRLGTVIFFPVRLAAVMESDTSVWAPVAL